MLGAWRPWTTPLVLCSNLRQPKHCLFRPYGSIPTNSEGYSCILSVLDLAGREFLFFTEACMVPSFGFVTKRALITHQCLCCCWTVFTQCQGLLHFSPCPTPVRRLACPKGWEGMQPGQLTKGILHTVVTPSCSAITLWWYATRCQGLVTSAQGLSGHWLAGGEMIAFESLVGLCFVVLFVFSIFSFSLTKFSLSQPISFLPFALPVPSPILLGNRERASACVVLSCPPGLTHSTEQNSSDDNYSERNINQFTQIK